MPVELARSGAVATITLNAPQRLNAMDIALQEDLRGRLAEVAQAPEIRALILTAAGKAFCVGADISTEGPMSAGTPGLGERTAATMRALSNQIIRDLRELHCPVVVALNGAAAGAGVGIALAGDIVVAAGDAYFYLPFIPRLGLVPDLGTTWFLERVIGRARAIELALLGERISAEKALAWGLIARCVERDDLAQEAMALAEKLARLPAHGALETRRAFDAAASNGLFEQLEYETDRQRVLVEKPEFAEGVKAFLERREPIFGNGTT